ncbi:MAG: sulfatase [Elusimicrobiales bacterium]
MPVIIRTVRLCAALAAAAPLCRTAAEPGPPPAGRYQGRNLLMISVTNIGAEHMSLYGYKRKTTPNLDAWAKSALVFEDAFTQASWTLPVATTLFTSLYPYAHRIMGRERNMLLSKNSVTLPELLKTSNYKTAAFTGGLDYMKSLGHMRGFTTASDNPPFTGFPVTIPQASAWLAKNRGGKFFLFVHGYDAHPPFIPEKRSEGVFSGTEGRHVTVDPAFTYRGYQETAGDEVAAYYHIPRKNPYEGNEKTPSTEKKTVLTRDDMDYLRDLYDEKVLDADRAAGAFLASLDQELLDRTIIVIFSEHGEMFARHGRFGRAGAIRGTLYDDVAHVPLLIKLPGARGERVRGFAQLVDIMPTLLELLELPVPRRAQGVSLLPLIEEGRPVNDFVYAGTRYNSYLPETYGPYGFASINESIRGEKWKLIHEITFPGPKDGPAARQARETFELYDLKEDPGEVHDLAAGHPDIVQELKRKLRQWAVSSRRFMNAEPASRKVSEEILETAKQHGYW